MARFQLSILALVSCIVQISAQCTVAQWGQCGGLTYTGCTTCASGNICQQWNPYYYQCIAGSTTASSTTSSTSTTRSSSSTTTTTSTTSTSTTSSTTRTSTSTTTSATSTNTLPVIPLSPTGLASYAKAKGKYIGSAYDNAYISDSAYNQVVFPNVNQLTCENSMKWDSVEQTQGDFSTTLWADRVVNITILNGMTLRGHTLVWHSQLPSWVTGGSWTNATLTSVMVNHITGEMTKYKGKIHTWDVVNEALNEDGSLRTSLFYNLIGETYIDIAFKTAKSVDSAAILAINDYNVDGTGSKSTGMTNLVTRVKARGAPIEQIGIQAHLIVGSVPTTLSTNWNNFVNLGVSIAITELDIRMPTPATSANLAQQATDYVNVVTACLNISKCLGITFWGMSDAHSWVSSTFSGQGAACLYDESMQPKAAYTAVQSLLAS